MGRKVRDAVEVGSRVRRRWLDRGPREGQEGDVLASRPCHTGTQYLVLWADGERWWVHGDVLECV